MPPVPINDRSQPVRVNIPHLNNFDLLRFSFAAIVFLVHAYRLTGNDDLAFFSRFLSSDLAVECFFVVSGFLIFMSYEYSPTLRTYFEKRVRRIYPAYFVVVVLCAVLGAMVSEHAFSAYFLSPDLYRYLAANLVFLNFLHPTLPGVFVENPLVAVNGALWTLKIEVMFYLSVPLLVWFFRKIGLWQGLSLAYLASCAYFYLMSVAAARHGGVYVELQRQLPGQLMYFIAGGALYYYFDSLMNYWKWLLLAAIAFFLIEYAYHPGMFDAAMVGIGVVYLACKFPYMGNFGKYGDFSYGVYILHFPILQVFVALHLFDGASFSPMLLATVLVLSSACLMWHGVEKPMLNKSSHYVAVNRRP